ncbi:MAG: YeeE/YedE family protein, partial [Bacteroidota bacterium]|nr:YeeE/YedE family protein [Bacteroidota bacterium]
MIDFLKQPWPWYITGPLIGLTVPALLILGNKTLGISSSLRHVCAACMPANISFFRYSWKKETWNL